MHGILGNLLYKIEWSFSPTSIINEYKPYTKAIKGHETMKGMN